MAHIRELLNLAEHIDGYIRDDGHTIILVKGNNYATGPPRGGDFARSSIEGLDARKVETIVKTHIQYDRSPILDIAILSPLADLRKDITLDLLELTNLFSLLLVDCVIKLRRFGHKFLDG